jgi:hypothetical protein
VRARFEQDGGGGVPKIMDSNLWYPPLQRDLEGISNRARFLRLAVLVREDQLPLGAKALLLESLDCQLRETDQAPAAKGLGLYEDQAAATLTLERALDLQPTGDQVDIAPLQAQRLSDAEASGAEDGP